MKTIVINNEFRELAKTDTRMQSHIDFIKNARQFASRNERHLLDLPRDAQVHVNAGIPILDFFRETDRAVEGVRLDDKFLFMDDLAGLAKTVSVGKLSAVSLKSSDISDDVSVSMDFNAAIKHDHISADSDRNPIPAFMAGVTMGYRHRAGLDSESIDLYGDSVTLKTRKLTEKVGSYMLNGDITIKADGQSGEGIKNHRNTQKLNLGAAGYNINLTSATRDEVVAFFNKSMKLVCNANTITKIDLVGVSPEIMVNLNTPLSNAQGFKVGTLMEEVLRFAPHIGGFVEDFALTGNEFYAYKRDASIIRPIVAMATGSFLLPRQSPVMGYTTQLVTAQGIEIKKTMNNKYGVFYASVIS
jgi:hypothetical protein